jgi:hypothetical protein
MKRALLAKASSMSRRHASRAVVSSVVAMAMCPDDT